MAALGAAARQHGDDAGPLHEPLREHSGGDRVAHWARRHALQRVAAATAGHAARARHARHNTYRTG